MAKLIDTAKELYGQVAGIFSNNQMPPNIEDEINTPDEEKLVKMVDYDYNIFREKRQPVEDVWRKEQRFDKGDHWTGLRPPDNGEYPERMEYNGNYAWSQLESIIARLTGWVPAPDFEATEEGDEEKAAMLNAFIPYELNQIKFKPKHIRAVRRMVIHGPLVYMTLYDPTIEGGRGSNRWNGQNDIIPLNLGSFFPDPSIKDFIYLQQGRAHIINHLLTLQYIRERWGTQGEKVQADNRSSETEIFDVDSLTSEGTSFSGENNQTTTNVLGYWYKGKPKYMSDEDIKLFKKEAKDKLAEGKDPSVDEAKAAGTLKGIHCLYVTTSGVFLEHKAYVYDHGQYPIVARTLFPEENNPWGKGYMRDLISPQTMYNRFCELAIEVTAKMGNAAIVYGTGALLESVKNIWKRMRGQAGAMLQVPGDVNQVKELAGVPPNPGILQYIQHFLEMMQKIPGMFDSSNGAASTDVNSGEQAKALIDASQGRLSLAAELIEDAVQEVIEQYVELCAQFYTSERIARVSNQTLAFSRDSIVSHAPTEYETGEQVPHPDTGEMMDEKLDVKEEYVPKFDIKVNIGVEKPKDRQYYIQTALTLLQTIDPVTQMPMIDAQAVRYTLENGRMEPMSIIEKRMGVEQQQMQKMQQLVQKNQQDEQEIAILTKQVEMLHGHLDESQQQDGQATADTLKALQDGDMQTHQKQMEIAQHQQGLDQQNHQQQIDVANTIIKAKQVEQAGKKVGALSGK